MADWTTLYPSEASANGLELTRCVVNVEEWQGILSISSGDAQGSTVTGIRYSPHLMEFSNYLFLWTLFIVCSEFLRILVIWEEMTRIAFSRALFQARKVILLGWKSTSSPSFKTWVTPCVVPSFWRDIFINTEADWIHLKNCGLLGSMLLRCPPGSLFWWDLCIVLCNCASRKTSGYMAGMYMPPVVLPRVTCSNYLLPACLLGQNALADMEMGIVRQDWLQMRYVFVSDVSKLQKL